MVESLKTGAKKLLAVGVLLIAAWILLKVVLGMVAALAWVIVAVMAVIALFWAIRTL